jgi:pimeloyl-ACP methyl ester carboxylesterase
MRKILFGLIAFLSLGGTALAGPLQPTRYLQHDGVRLAVYESCGTELPGVLLIHGNTSAADSYSRVLESPLGHRRRLVAVDLAGYGRSDDAPAYDVATFADEIAFAAQATGVDDGFIVGWSLGGDLALQAAALLPDVKGYFLFGTAPVGYAPELPPPFLSADESYAGAAVSYGFVADLTPRQVTDYVTAFFRPDYHFIPWTFYRDGLRTDPGTRNAVLMAAAGLDPTFADEVAIVKNLDVPIELVLGTHDAFVRPEYLEGLAPDLPTLHRGEISYVHAGHAVHYEAPEHFAALLEDFMRDTLHHHGGAR